ncbi:MAG: hypothetical protein HY720_14710 [Planctomycetes bacterium]|nr:hypothetical protein [Planctomycetota bacterium]
MQNERKIIDRVRQVAADHDRPAPEELRDIAEQFAELTRRVGNRLAECATYLAQGLRTEARHVASSNPPLLDLARRLQAEDLEPWLEVCRVNRLPEPAGLSAGVVDMVEFAIEEDRNPDLERLCRTYRRVTLLGTVRDRLQVLRRIRIADPGNAIWHEDLDLLEAHRLGQIEEDAYSAYRRKDGPALRELLAELDSPDWSRKPSRSTLAAVDRRWRDVQNLVLGPRARQVADAIVEAHGRQDFEASVVHQREWEGIIDEGFTPDDAILERKAGPMKWLEAEARRREALAGLDTAVGSARGSAELARALSAVEALCPIPPQLAERTHVRLAALRRAESRRLWIRIGAVAAVGIVLLLLAVMGIRAHDRANRRAAWLERVDEKTARDDWKGARVVLEELDAEDSDLAQEDDFTTRGKKIEAELARIQARSDELSRLLAHVEAMAAAGYEPFEKAEESLGSARKLLDGSDQRGRWSNLWDAVAAAKAARQHAVDHELEVRIDAIAAGLVSLSSVDPALDPARFRQELDRIRLEFIEAGRIAGASPKVEARLAGLDGRFASAEAEYRDGLQRIEDRRRERRSLYEALPDVALYERAVKDLLARQDLSAPDRADLEWLRDRCRLYIEAVRTHDWFERPVEEWRASPAASETSPWSSTLRRIEESSELDARMREGLRGTLQHLRDEPLFSSLLEYSYDGRTFYCSEEPVLRGNSPAGGNIFEATILDEKVGYSKHYPTTHGDRIETVRAAHSRYLDQCAERAEKFEEDPLAFLWQEVRILSQDREINPVLAVRFALEFLDPVKEEEDPALAPFRALHQEWKALKAEEIGWPWDSDEVRQRKEPIGRALAALPDLENAVRGRALRALLDKEALRRGVRCAARVELGADGIRPVILDQAALELWAVDTDPDHGFYFYVAATRAPGGDWVFREEALRLLREPEPLFAPGDGRSTRDVLAEAIRTAGLSPRELDAFPAWPPSWPLNERTVEEDR